MRAGVTLASCGVVGKEARAATRAHLHAWKPAQIAATRGVSAEDVRAAIQSRIGGPPSAPITAHSWHHVQRMYERYSDNPLWLTNDGLDRARVAGLFRVLADADKDGLDPARYPLTELNRVVTEIDSVAHPTAAQLAQADVLLTAGYVSFAEDLLTGELDPSTLSQSWHISPNDERTDSALVSSLRTDPLDESLALMRPQDSGYAALKQQLTVYREIVAHGGWSTVPDGPLLRPGMTGSAERLSAVRSRLAAEGIVPDTGAKPALYNRALAGGVAQFQMRHGIPVDSILGGGTDSSLNLPAEYRLGQIAANLERYRWTPRILGSRYIIVNVPAFHLDAYDSGQKALEMKVIVGADYQDKATPVFSDSMRFVVFRPYWDITDDIARRETIPKIQADPTYMDANALEYYREDGQQHIRQRPGPKNSLGLVKFIFPNDFNVYLHDTPEGELFQKDVRAFSHGCIRLEHPAELAQFVLGWPADKVQAAMQTGADNQRVKPAAGDSRLHRLFHHVRGGRSAAVRQRPLQARRSARASASQRREAFGQGHDGRRGVTNDRRSAAGTP